MEQRLWSAEVALQIERPRHKDTTTRLVSLETPRQHFVDEWIVYTKVILVWSMLLSGVLTLEMGPFVESSEETIHVCGLKQRLQLDQFPPRSPQSNQWLTVTVFVSYTRMIMMIAFDEVIH